MFYTFKFGKDEGEVITVPEIKDGIAYYIDGGRKGTMSEKILKKNFDKVKPEKKTKVKVK